MSEKTGIAWTDHTWNCWQGCTKVSPGCAHCYMFRDKVRYGQDPETVIRSKPLTFNAPLKWKKPARVFTCSWSDFFHEAADEWRPEAWAIIKATPHLTYQILTKRPERILAHLPWGAYGDPWPNVWLGVSVENQRWVERARQLATIPAAVRFISCEPLLGPVELDELLKVCKHWKSEDTLFGEIPCHPPYPKHGYKPQALVGAGWQQPIGWLIAGGESGPDARPMELNWARSLRDQCAAAGVAYFLKQLGGHPDARAHEKATLDGKRYTEMPV